MRGGSRPGAGRKPGPPTVRVRVPLECLSEVKAVVEQFLKADRQEGAEFSKLWTEFKEQTQPEQAPEVEQPESTKLKSRTEIKLDDSQRAARKELERLPKDVQRKIRNDYGTLTAAVLAGIRAEGRRAVLREQE